jgi:hypothetical protein
MLGNYYIPLQGSEVRNMISPHLKKELMGIYLSHPKYGTFGEERLIN